jgi:DNA-binding CsgD family transcriptional regulator
MRTLSAHTGAVNMVWVGAARLKGWEQQSPNDQLLGWRPRASVYLHLTEARLRANAIAMEMVRKNRPDPHTVAVTRGFGKNRSHLREELVSNSEWKRSWLYQEFLRPQGVDDRLVCVYAAAPNAESYLILDREPSVRRFGRRERDLMAFFLQAGRIFHLELLQSYGLLQASRPLSPRERDVLRLLLTGETEKEIAQGLGLTPATLHQYVVGVLRKFGAHSRTDLMAQWLRRLAPPVSPTPTD